MAPDTNFDPEGLFNRNGFVKVAIIKENRVTLCLDSPCIKHPAK